MGVWLGVLVGMVAIVVITSPVGAQAVVKLQGGNDLPPLPSTACESIAPSTACDLATQACGLALSVDVCNELRQGHLVDCNEILPGQAVCSAAVPTCWELASAAGHSELGPACQTVRTNVCLLIQLQKQLLPNYQTWVPYALCELVSTGHVTFCMAWPHEYCEEFGEGVPELGKLQDALIGSAQTLREFLDGEL